jgi:hypothetical protein
MAFPPNYRQERQSRDRAKQQKAAAKLAEREARAADRKRDTDPQDTAAPSDGEKE